MTRTINLKANNYKYATFMLETAATFILTL